MGAKLSVYTIKGSSNRLSRLTHTNLHLNIKSWHIVLKTLTFIYHGIHSLLLKGSKKFYKVVASTNYNHQAYLKHSMALSTKQYSKFIKQLMPTNQNVCPCNMLDLSYLPYYITAPMHQCKFMFMMIYHS